MCIYMVMAGSIPCCEDHMSESHTVLTQQTVVTFSCVPSTCSQY